MAPSHNVVLLVDTADPAAKHRVRLLSLRLLNFLTCRAGLGRVRWSYRFLNSLGGRCRPPRRSDLREVGPRSWGEFEEELEACWERAGQSRACHTPSSRAGLTHTALMDTLSDFQWDRPDISSPTKPLRARRARRGPAGGEAADKAQCGSRDGGGNAVFLLSPCPHTASQLGHFTTGTGGDSAGDTGLQQVMDRLLPRGLQSIITSRRVTLHWLDTMDWAQERPIKSVWNLSEHSGYLTMVELMQLIGGRVLPSASLLLSSSHQLSFSHFNPTTSLNIPCDSVLNYVICSEADHRLLFPQQNGVVFFIPPGVAADRWECPVTLEPLSISQRHSKSLTIRLKGIVQHWSQNQNSSLTTETWILQNSAEDMSCCHLPELLRTLLSGRLHMAADVFTEEDLCPRTGVLTPISQTSAILNVICSGEKDGLGKFCLPESLNNCEDTSDDLSDIVSSALRNVSPFSDHTSVSDLPVPEWINQELTQKSRWNSSIVEKWYSLSGASGVSCFLMESFRLIHAGACDEDDPLKCDQEITHYLSDYYELKSNEETGIAAQGENPKKRLPRTPVRQKMKTMPRALQMLNAARLIKAQKSQPDNVLAVPNEKNSQAKKRTSDKQDDKAKSLKVTGFKSEDELFALLNEDYEKAISVQEDSLLTCAKNAITTIRSYMKSNLPELVEMDCVSRIRHLLKTSKTIRQLYGNNQKKETKLRECQIQVFLRLEMCAQCPVLQTNTDDLEQTVEEITDMLRIISLTEDPSFLTKFLNENVLVEYITVMPKILAEIYFSLGTQIPEDLALVLPADDEDSIVHEGITPVYSQPSVSRVPSIPQLVTEEDQLEELRTKSARKRSTITRHRSIAESSQVMRQIEIPKKQTNKENLYSNPVVMVEKLKMPDPVKPKKDSEATKAKRTLFENKTPTKKCHKMPRSQSVSAVEDLKHKRSKSSDGIKENYKLLTKKVSETPVRKQISNRLLHKQIKGRRSESTSNISIVEESPEKDIKDIDVRRSPRIKQLAFSQRSSSFYASQPKSRNLERVHSFTQQQLDADHTANRSMSEIKSPKQLLFGEVLKMTSPPAKKFNLDGVERVDSQGRGKTKRNILSKAFEDLREKEKLLRKSPRTPKTPIRISDRLKTPSKSTSERKKAAKNLVKMFSPSKVNEPPPSRSCGKSDILAHVTPKKSISPKNLFVSPLRNKREQAISQREDIPQFPVSKRILRTPTKSSNSTMLQYVSGTPTKSPYKLLESVAPFSTPNRYVFRTPQKPVVGSVSRTPTQKEEVCTHTLHCANECTPEKQILLSPAKRISSQWSKSPHGMSKRIYSNSPSHKHSLENNSIFLCDQTPKTSSQLIKSSCTPKFTRALEPPSKSTNGHPCTKAEENSKALSNVSVHIQQGASDGDIDSCQTSTLSKEFISPTTPSITKNKISSPCLKTTLISNHCSPKCRIEPVVLCEKLDLSTLESTFNSESYLSGSQTEESIDIADAVVVPTETSELKMKVLITRKSSNSGLQNSPSVTPACGINNASTNCTYGLRCTPDRRQREAAARLGETQIPAQFSTPKSHKSLLAPGIPTYEVELEMQASGLPKLRFKRTDSGSTVDMETGNRTESPLVTRKWKGEESPFSEKWCSKHTTKLESSCVSPSFLRSHATPGKCSHQTHICLSYTPNRCTSYTSSSSQIDVGVPWTPSPKFKEKNGSDAINNWPRRKKASALNCVLKGEKNQEYADLHSIEEDVGVLSKQEVSKSSSLEDFELEGVSKLQEKSPVLQWQGTGDSRTFRLNSRKRSLGFLSPTEETPQSKRQCKERNLVSERSQLMDTIEISSPCQRLSSNRSSSQQSSCDDDVFSNSGFTPPNKILKNPLSTSALLTLTQSPMLYQGKTPLSKRKMMHGKVYLYWSCENIALL
ncbi:treslin [Pelobates cultripes]|uniref:Treslin n=1 Tax=Pelobates cultripes TaxID=61616 RepID=A0AAD1VZ00_PELCU|nr:treslin [Pelobates cultripes]